MADFLFLLKAAILGVVEGLTEFLPVSSTGHLIIVGDLLDFTGDNAKVFEIVIQLGAILGVAWDYRARLARVLTHFADRTEQRFVLNLLLAFLPAAIVGVLFHHQIKTHLFNPVSVAIALIVGGALILVIERLPLRPRVAEVDAMRPADAIKIGLAQTLSLFPGVSRAGATIMGGLLAGLSRTAATEFSFFLAMPVMLAATAFELFGNLDGMNRHDLLALAVGFVLSFVTAMVVVRLFLRYVSRHDFTVFAWYRIGFGLLVLLYFW
jgi:undecaprenyl-diphosphatase